ncbi:RluA family pseudouridine synthase [Acidocella sp.]|uniref:RluA family pseudouridine synthase n=1 Tax=Acidocella sp. TaxID=50710 RepID=UPI003D034977
MNKPAGLPVYPGRAGGASIEDFFPLWRKGKTGPWLAHRLDQDTAGCLLIARKKAVLLEAQALLGAGGAEKRYWAILRGVPEAASGEIDAPLAKVTEGRRWRMAVRADGQPARTLWRVLGARQGRALVEFSLLTGRTHQARAHAAHLGHPVLGDPVYGVKGEGPMCLLARRLRLPMAAPIDATAPAPAHMAPFVEDCLGTL